MHMIYNSLNYCVVEFKASESASYSAGYEIMDKTQRREIYLDGFLADQFRQTVDKLLRDQPDAEQVDAFLSQFQGLMQQPLTLH
jgi:hypothetical protein